MCVCVSFADGRKPAEERGDTFAQKPFVPGETFRFENAPSNGPSSFAHPTAIVESENNVHCQRDYTRVALPIAMRRTARMKPVLHVLVRRAVHRTARLISYRPPVGPVASSEHCAADELARLGFSESTDDETAKHAKTN